MHVISASDLMPPDWGFLRDRTAGHALSWSTHSGLPRSALERRVRRPHLGRYRAGLQATGEARGRADALLVGHLPLMTAATNLLRRQRCPGVPMIGFSFNFTTRPTGMQRRYLTRALQGIDEYVVYSRFEQREYPDLFDLDPARVRFLPWAMDPPKPGPENPVTGEGSYLCAIGGEGRDYALLARVMHDLPALRMVVIARPYSIAGIDFPDNVQVFTNLPLAQTWRVARDSGGLVIPLVSPETACGHITLVGAQLLGIPLALTRSRGVADYVEDGPAATARLIEAGVAGDLRAAIAELAEDPAGAQGRAEAARARAEVQNGLDSWVGYFAQKARDFGL